MPTSSSYQSCPGRAIKKCRATGVESAGSLRGTEAGTRSAMHANKSNRNTLQTQPMPVRGDRPCAVYKGSLGSLFCLAILVTLPLRCESAFERTPCWKQIMFFLYKIVTDYHGPTRSLKVAGEVNVSLVIFARARELRVLSKASHVDDDDDICKTGK